MFTSISKFSVHVTRYYTESTTVGVIYEIPSYPHTRYLAEGRDFGSDSSEYNPTILGVFDDPAQAVKEIERHLAKG